MQSAEQNDLLTRTPTGGWQGYWRKTDETRRKASTWASQ
jgi:hypothetical protein